MWHVVKQYAGALGFRGLAPHDLRRSCAKLCHAAGGELEQIQFLLGHVSVQTTERYLGCKQRIRGAIKSALNRSRAGVGVRRRRHSHLTYQEADFLPISQRFARC